MKGYAEALEWLYSTQLFGIKPGLEPVFRMTEVLGVPLEPKADAGRPVFRIHVAGTNGKGSTCALLASVCRRAGLRTGLYTSPHLVSFRERIQVNGECIPEDAVLRGVEMLRRLVERWEPHPTFFELVTVLGLWWFHQNAVEALILETGMGGRLDATNVVTPAVSVLTPVGMDHQKYLGETLELIAGEKAGIIKPGVPVCSAPQSPEVRRVFSEAAYRAGSRLQWIVEPWTQGDLALRGEVQRWNAALAEASLLALPFSFSREVVRQGLSSAQWPGRFERVRRDLVLDGAHNPHAAAQLVSTWRSEYGCERAHVVFGAAEDKDVAMMLRILGPVVETLTLVSIRGKRAMPLEELRELAVRTLPGVPVRTGHPLEEILAERAEGVRLVTGSLFLVGEALAVVGGLPREHSLQ